MTPGEGVDCEGRGVGVAEADGADVADGVEVPVGLGLGVWTGDGCAIAMGTPRPPTRPIVRSDKLTL